MIAKRALSIAGCLLALGLVGCVSEPMSLPDTDGDGYITLREQIIADLRALGTDDTELTFALPDLAPPLSAMDIGRATSDEDRAAVIAAREAAVIEIHTSIAREFGLELRGVLWLGNSSKLRGPADRLLACVLAHPEGEVSYNGPIVSESVGR